MGSRADAAPPPILDRELFFGNPEIAGAQLSPDGQFVAFQAPEGHPEHLGDEDGRDIHLASTTADDPKRIGIMGSSYGGYATLAGVAFTPDLYAAAVDIVCPSNLITLPPPRASRAPPRSGSQRTIGRSSRP